MWALCFRLRWSWWFCRSPGIGNMDEMAFTQTSCPLTLAVHGTDFALLVFGCIREQMCITGPPCVMAA